MDQKNRSPGANGARQQFSDHVQNAANIAKSATALAIQPCWADVESFTGEQYDEVFENGLTSSINALITFASTCRDRDDAILIRPSETIAALANVMAAYIAMTPDVTPAQIHTGVENIAAHLYALAVDMARDPKPLIVTPSQGEGWLS